MAKSVGKNVKFGPWLTKQKALNKNSQIFNLENNHVVPKNKILNPSYKASNFADCP